MTLQSRYLSEEQELQVVAKYKAGASGTSLASEYGCSKPTIYKAIRRQGETSRQGPGVRRLVPDQEQAVLAAYLAGEPMRSILSRFGISVGSVYEIRAQHGVPARPAIPTSRLFNQEQEQALIASYREGRSLSDLGREYGCCLEAVRKVLKRNGVERRRRGNSLRQFTEEQVAECAKRWEAGESQHSIGKSLGLPQPQVSRLLRDTTDQPPRTWVPRGSRHSMWKGGRVSLGTSYIGVRLEADDPFRVMAQSQGYVLEHRLVMARSLGRPLLSTETVHHVNGIRTDNRLENLQLRQGLHGTGKVLRCGDCGSSNIVDAPLRD